MKLLFIILVTMGFLGQPSFTMITVPVFVPAHIIKVDPPVTHDTYYGKASYFNANWQHVINVNKEWGNLPAGYKGYGSYAAMPESWAYQGKRATVKWCEQSVDVQLIDVVARQDTASFLARGRVIDLGQSVFARLWSGCYPGRSYLREDEGILQGVSVTVK